MKKTALLIIDVQLGMFDERFPVFKGDDLLNTIQSLIRKARTAQIPIVFVQHNGKEANDPIYPGLPGWQIHPAIAPLEGDTIIHKDHPDAFQDTDLQEKLQSLGITHLVEAGIQTEYCVDTTCRRAYSLGYQITLVKDGHSTWDTEILSAPQIIAHHNQVLGGWFADVKPAAEITFSSNPQ
jgi:nicotinamidase-related amidase